MKKAMLFGAILLICPLSIFSQEEDLPLDERNEQRLNIVEAKVDKLNNLKITGYVQTQFQWAAQEGIEAFGSGGSFNTNTNNRLSIRRGRIKFAYTAGPALFVLQPDFTEKGVGLKDMYLNLTTPNKAISLQTGLFDRNFGYEIEYSSSVRESPERSRVFLSLFPGERDLGAKIALKGTSGILANFTLNAGLFAGNGVGVETDSRKDFIGRLAYLQKMDDMQIGVAVSYYNGGILNKADSAYKYNNESGFAKESSSKYSKREYYGISTQYLQNSVIGMTNLRAECVFGTNPGTSTKNSHSNSSPTGTGAIDIYNRAFSGYYAILVQDIGQTKHSVVLKYDYFDPNTAISGDEIGDKKGTGSADIAYSTFGLGYLYRLNSNIRLMAYYDFVNNERSAKLANASPIKDLSQRIDQNVFTLRLQVKF